MRAFGEMLVGVVLMGSALIGVDCAINHKHLAATQPAVAACPAPLHAAPMLCNRVRDDVECAICPDPDRKCITSTHIYCVADSCDDPSCAPRH